MVPRGFFLMYVCTYQDICRVRNLLIQSFSAGNSQSDKKSETKPYYYIPPVPGDMGWLWNAEDIPGLKVSCSVTLIACQTRKFILDKMNRII